MNIPSWIKAIFFIALCEIAGMLGSLVTFSQIPTWYAGLVKPMLNPPSWIFGPVWALLYALMGIALYIVWEQYHKINIAKKKNSILFAMWIFAAQLLLNILWSILFFGLHNPILAFLDLAAMWLAILATIYVFAPISKTASYLLIPYIVWVTFAGYLNVSIWQLNKTSTPQQYACTQEALMCPDGSYVSRTGPQCEFAKCP
ncbi:MAG TPA: TspO/MBR family protein [Candidatus Andersenbacteria bacterium]|nr:TspO/MBR family protein [Candidatus Andersenbacteria bacterium]